MPTARFMVYLIVDYGTTFEQAFIVRDSDVNGIPSSAKCLDAFVKGWTRPFGWPKNVAGCRGAFIYYEADEIKEYI